MRLSHATDTRLLVVGGVAFLALVAYLAVAFANTHASNSPLPSAASKDAPWTPYGSDLVATSLGRPHKYAVRVTRASDGAATAGSYGALAPTLISEPQPGTRFVLGLWLKAARPVPLGVQAHLFRAGTPSRYLIDTTVHATTRWRHFTFNGRVAGNWTGLSAYVYRPSTAAASPPFTIRGVTINPR